MNCTIHHVVKITQRRVVINNFQTIDFVFEDDGGRRSVVQAFSEKAPEFIIEPDDLEMAPVDAKVPA